jgi:hypothetical protein
MKRDRRMMKMMSTMMKNLKRQMKNRKNYGNPQIWDSKRLINIRIMVCPKM